MLAGRSAATALALASIALASLLSLAPAPPPLLYAPPAALATLAFYLGTGSREALVVGAGGSLAQLLLGLVLLGASWSPTPYPVVGLSAHLAVLVAIACSRGVECRPWAWLSLALAGLAWGLEARALALAGAPSESVLGRAHLLLVGLSATAPIYASLLEDDGWRRLLVYLSASTPLLVASGIQGGLLARDVYQGSLVALAYSAYAIAAVLLSSPPREHQAPVAKLRAQEEGTVRVGVSLAYSILWTAVILEALGLASPREHAELVRALQIPGAAALIVFAGALAGSLVGAGGAALVALATPYLLLRAGVAGPVGSYVVGHALASLALLASAKRAVRVYAPILVLLLVSPLILSMPIEPPRSATYMVELNSTVFNAVTLTTTTTGFLEDLSFDKREGVLTGSVPVSLGYKGRWVNTTIAFRFYYSREEGWVFEKPLSTSMRVGGDVVKATIEPSPSLEAFLQAYYTASLAMKTPELRQSGALLVTVSVYRGVEEVAARLALLASAPGIAGLLLESPVYGVLSRVILVSRLERIHKRLPFRR